MPDIPVAQLCTYIAYALKHRNGNRHVAVGFNNNQVLGVGLDTRLHGSDPATAVVNLFQADYAQLTGNFSIATTYPPLECCLGMAKMMRATVIYHYVGPNLRRTLMAPNPPWNPAAIHGGAQAAVASVPGGFDAAGDKAVRAHTWWNLLEQAYIHPNTRNFFIYAEHSIVQQRTDPPAQVGLLPALAASLATAMTGTRRAILTTLVQVIVAATGFSRRALGHNIGCVIADDQGEIIDWGVNRNQVNPTFHAETYAVMNWMRRTGRQPFPNGCELFTTLESCHMCAGVIHVADPLMQVHYIQDDPLIVNSVLARANTQHLANPAQAFVGDLARQFRQLVRDPQTTRGLNSPTGFMLMSEAVHLYKRMQYYLPAATAAEQDDVTVWRQGADLANSICANLI